MSLQENGEFLNPCSLLEELELQLQLEEVGLSTAQLDTAAGREGESVITAQHSFQGRKQHAISRRNFLLLN